MPPTPPPPRRDTLQWQFVGTITVPPSVLVTTAPPQTNANSDVVVQIRNPISVDAMNPPMIIVDGVIQMGASSLADVNLDPARIGSIEVVRGAAATALYGQRAANGVINITTKKN
jgi:TonB-dependent SusC/RagA subfamily outer membrane receptor